ncbi:glycosyltransferase family 1 protein [Collybia nuda]|uniref:UDP-N-acetylglucosamine transferase subunit ALG14 n=1 Tax=Collybia nuda TaxID=64659 RepID=A0A9P6CLN2_9AGAR|nr:glycosyltransferase family 1 protein [Collybia nuda]
MLSPSLVFLSLLLCLIRLYLIIPTPTVDRQRRRKNTDTCSLAVFLGSGGHTSEILTLVSAVNFSRYTPRKYIVSEGDHLSVQKAAALELLRFNNASKIDVSNNEQYTILTIPRARQVHQSLLSTLPSAVLSLVACLYHVVLVPMFFPKGNKYGFADALLLNGPGTCFVLCIAVYVNKFLGLPAPKIIYVESFARVQSLSLSGRLLRPFVDRFIVQWPQLLQDRSRGEYHNWLV